MFSETFVSNFTFVTANKCGKFIKTSYDWERFETLKKRMFICSKTGLKVAFKVHDKCFLLQFFSGTIKSKSKNLL